MKSTTIIIVLLLLLCGAMYFWGKKNGTTALKATIINKQLMMQQMYVFTNEQLSNNAGYHTKAREHITTIFTEYYKPLGYKVICNFTQP